RFAGMWVISISTAGGSGEEQDSEIYNGLNHIFMFLKELHRGRNNIYQTSFPILPLLAQKSVEQIEEEGGIEEIESQLINEENYYCNINDHTKQTKGLLLNNFIHWSNKKPRWYYW
ncbi:MAG: hypothetical protein EZS28_010234, partial [Streblomastix strix]